MATEAKATDLGSPEKSDVDDGDRDRERKEEAAADSRSPSKQQQHGEDDSAGDGNENVDDEDSDEDESSSDDDDDGSSDDEAYAGLSEYERYRLKRIARNKARLASLGFSEPSEEKRLAAEAARKKKQKTTPAKPRRSLPEGPRRQLPGRAKRATFNESAAAESAKRCRRAEEEKNPDACYVCQKEEGELIICDYCRKLYHPGCHDPPISPDDDEFKCAPCVAAGRKRRLACGKCHGCVRTTDCGTCVACVSKSEGGFAKSKCVFRKCQSWGKAKLIRAVDPNDGDANKAEDGEERDDGDDSHDTECFVCKSGGDLICCDGCSKVYHSNCHKPKIWDLPEGEWYCMECNRSKKEKERTIRMAALSSESSKKKKYARYTGPLVADVGHKVVKCTVRWPSMECAVCDGKEATGVFKPPDWTTCRLCHDSYHLKCLDPPLDFAPNKWKCPTCKERKVKAKTPKEKKEAKPLFEGEHDDDCFMCYQGGDLICCDFCSKAYHLGCHLPPLTEVPTGLWKCQECAAVEYVRKMKCGECEACTRDDCGECQFCLDKPKFGGANRLKQTCVKKVCPYKRFAPPTKATPQGKPRQTKNNVTTGKRKRKNKDGPDDASPAAHKKTTEEGNAADSKKSFDDVPKQKQSQPTKREKAVHPSAVSGKTPREQSQPTKRQKAVHPSAASGETPRKQSRPTKRQKVEHPSAARGKTPKGNQPTKESALDPDIEYQRGVDQIINSRPLKNDPVGNKMRKIIIHALKHPGNSEIQTKACQVLHLMAINADNVSKITLLGGVRMVSKAMKGHSGNATVQFEASALLAGLWVNPPCIAAIVEEGCPQLVLTSMSNHGVDLKVQQMGCGFFRAMSHDFANHRSIYNINGVGAVIDAMKRNSKKYDILKEGCYFLQNILCNPAAISETIQILTAKGAIPLIVDAMMCATSDDTDYLEVACGLLANLATNDNARSQIGSYSASITTLLQILGPGISVDACKSSLDTLALLATENHTCQARIVSLDGIRILIHFLTPPAPNAVALADSGIKLLSELITNNKANAQLLADAHGLEFVTSVMRGHPDLAYLQASCCRVLRNLPTGNTDKVNDTVALILEAMQKHRNDKMVQFEGCHVLLQFCCSYPGIAELLQSQGILLSADLRSSKGNRVPSSKFEEVDQLSHDECIGESVQLSSVAENASLKVDDTSREIDSIIKTKPLKDDPVGNKIRLAIIKALKHPENSKFQDKACEYLRKMSVDTEHVSKIVHLGGLRMVSKAMKDHCEKPIVQAEACALLAEIAWVNPYLVDAVVKEGCLPLALSSMQHHPTHLKVQQMACGFFRALSYEFENHESIDNVNGVEAVIDAMIRNAKKYDILKEGFYFLQNMLCNPGILLENIQLVVSKGIVQIMIDSIREKSDDAEILGAACGLLSNLAIDEGAREHIGGNVSCIPTLLAVLGSGLDMDACKCSINALKLLATGNDVSQNKIVLLGGINTVMKFLTLPNDVLLVYSGLGLLSELIRNNKQNSELLLNVGGLDFVTTEMATHSNSPHLQAISCGILRHLPIGKDKANDAVNLVLTAMKTHSDDGLVQYEGCRALLQYCCHVPSTAKLMKSEEAVPILVQSQFMLRLPTSNQKEMIHTVN